MGIFKNIIKFIHFLPHAGIKIDIIHKGTVKSGGWLCLEEVDRLREQLISALTHHMRQLGVASGSPGQGNPTCAVLATSNKNIPRPLVAQFRPVALQPPDDALVTQFMLKSRGFTNDQKYFWVVV
jgi:hypothetical protein